MALIERFEDIAEGFDCESKKEFARFLEIARRSTVEMQSLLYVALDVNYIDEAMFKNFYDQAATTKRLIGALRHAVLKRT